MLPITDDFEAQTARYWSAERQRQSFGAKRLILTPTTAPRLLRRLGLLNGDSSMNHASLRKFLQINHLLSLLEPHLKELAHRFSPLTILDAGCGKSYLTFLLAWYFTEKLPHAVEILGIDHQSKIIASCRRIAEDLSMSSVSFHASSVSTFEWQSFSSEGQKPRRLNAVFALHACDTATDHALALGMSLKADLIGAAPCCQAELAQWWKERAPYLPEHPLRSIFHSPNIRREMGAHCTDMLRVLMLRSRGYQVTATEFIPSEHTPKNRLISAVRRGNYLTAARDEYEALKQALGGPTLAIESIVNQEGNRGS